MTTALPPRLAVQAAPDLCRYAALTMRDLEALLPGMAAASVVEGLWAGTLVGEVVPGRGWGYRAAEPPPEPGRRPGMLRGIREVRAAALEVSAHRHRGRRYA